MTKTPPRQIVNTTTTGTYKPAVMQSPRPAADDHLKYKSLGQLLGKVAA
jgi:hypothetical protein